MAQDQWKIGGVSSDDAPVPRAGRAGAPESAGLLHSRGERGQFMLAFVAGLVGVAAIAATAFVFSETQRELRRLSGEIAQIKISLELFARNQTNAPAAPELGELEARLTVLESVWRSGSQADGTSLPVLPVPPGPSAVSDGDCLPAGTRFLVTAGDRYPVCGTQGMVEVLSVGAVDIAFGDGTAVAIGGSTTLANTSCTLGVLSANADGLSGYGEIRVNC